MNCCTSYPLKMIALPLIQNIVLFWSPGVWPVSVFFETLSRKFKSSYNLTRTTGTLLEDLCTFMISRSILHKMKTFWTKVVGNIRTYIFCSITFSHKTCRVWNNAEIYGKAIEATDDLIRCMSFACCMTDTHSEYVMLIDIPPHHWLHECASMLYTFIRTLPLLFNTSLMVLRDWTA
jgi:hypothetical protein